MPDAIKAQVFAMEEKGSDVNLAAHLINDCCLGNFDAAAVITNDTDLVEPIRIVTKEHGKPVLLLCPAQRGAAAPLRQVATTVRHINRAHLNASLFPDPITIAATGQVVAKPTSW